MCTLELSRLAECLVRLARFDSAALSQGVKEADVTDVVLSSLVLFSNDAVTPGDGGCQSRSHASERNLPAQKIPTEWYAILGRLTRLGALLIRGPHSDVSLVRASVLQQYHEDRAWP